MKHTLRCHGFGDAGQAAWRGPATQRVKALAAPEVVKQFSIQGFEAVGSTPADFAKFVAQQSAFMNDLARKIESGSK